MNIAKNAASADPRLLRSVRTEAITFVKSEEEEKRMVAATSEITPAPTSKTTVQASRGSVKTCHKCHKQPLSYNNTSGRCTGCQRQHGRPRPNGNGHKAQPLEHKAAKSNGADHDPAHGNGKITGNGNGAHPAQDRLDMLMAIIPREDKARMLTAWLAGSL